MEDIRDQAYNTYIKAKEALLKASKHPKLGKYITEDKITEAFKNSVFCYTDEAFLKNVKKIDPTATTRDIISLSAFQDVENKKIILKGNCSIEQFIHEVVHYISLNGKDTGILGIGTELINDTQNSDWNGLDLEDIDALNEAITHYITQVILPEKDIQDAYTYGGNFLKNYSNESGNIDKILDAYFGKDKDSLNFIAKDVNKEGLINWHDIIKVSKIYQHTNTGLSNNFAENFEKFNTELKKEGGINDLISKISEKNRAYNTNNPTQEDDIER